MPAWMVAVVAITLIILTGTVGLVTISRFSRHSTGAVSGIAFNRGPSPGFDITLPKDGLPPFVCASEAMGSGAAGQRVVSVIGLATATQPGYDRVAIELRDGLPSNIEVRAQQGTDFTSPAGRRVTLAGSNGILVVVHGANLAATYHGPADIATRYTTLREVRVIASQGDFQLAFGISGSACYRVMLVNNPDRIVIDVETP